MSKCNCNEAGGCKFKQLRGAIKGMEELRKNIKLCKDKVRNRDIYDPLSISERQKMTAYEEELKKMQDNYNNLMDIQ